MPASAVVIQTARGQRIDARGSQSREVTFPPWGWRNADRVTTAAASLASSACCTTAGIGPSSTRDPKRQHASPLSRGLRTHHSAAQDILSDLDNLRCASVAVVPAEMTCIVKIDLPNCRGGGVGAGEAGSSTATSPTTHIVAISYHSGNSRSAQSGNILIPRRR